MTRRRHAEIAGAGMAGLTAAAALCQRGWTVRVHERMPGIRTVGSGLSIFENALRVMRAIGAEEDAVHGARQGFERETRDARGRTTSHMTYATTMFEITREQDTAKAAEIEAWLDLVAGAYNVLPMDAGAFRHWARLMHRQSDTLYEDAMIAATAQAHGLTVATRNVADFRALGVEVFNPFR